MTDRVSPTSQERFARRQRVGRWGRYRLTLVPALLVVVVAIVVWAVGFSGLIDVRAVVVRGLGGDSGLSAGDIRRAADVPLGEPLARLDLEAVRARVEALPGVREADVARGWPHDVVVDVVERTAVVAWQDGSTVRLVDRHGVPFRTVPVVPGRLSALVVPAGDLAQARPLLAAGARVVAALPSTLGKDVELIAVESPDAVRLRLTGDVTVMWGNAADSTRKAKVLSALLTQGKKMYDVSVPDFPTVRG